MAAETGVVFATLSPVLPTTTHPGALPIGWQRAAEFIDRTTLPVYCLGGLTEEHLQQATDVGAQGIAAISSWW